MHVRKELEMDRCSWFHVCLKTVFLSVEKLSETAIGAENQNGTKMFIHSSLSKKNQGAERTIKLIPLFTCRNADFYRLLLTMIRFLAKSLVVGLSSRRIYAAICYYDKSKISQIVDCQETVDISSDGADYWNKATHV
jgi:hypothetical protein